jgi:hypothetical protein
MSCCVLAFVLLCPPPPEQASPVIPPVRPAPVHPAGRDTAWLPLYALLGRPVPERRRSRLAASNQRLEYRAMLRSTDNHRIRGVANVAPVISAVVLLSHHVTCLKKLPILMLCASLLSCIANMRRGHQTPVYRQLIRTLASSGGTQDGCGSGSVAGSGPGVGSGLDREGLHLSQREVSASLPPKNGPHIARIRGQSECAIDKGTTLPFGVVARHILSVRSDACFSGW